MSTYASCPECEDFDTCPLGDHCPVAAKVECLDSFQGECSGSVEYRYPLSGTGRSFPRCDRHWGLRLDKQEQINQRYGHPDSSVPPADFQPDYCGESWEHE